jgi:hypothetical protein
VGLSIDLLEDYGTLDIVGAISLLMIPLIGGRLLAAPVVTGALFVGASGYSGSLLYQGLFIYLVPAELQVGHEALIALMWLYYAPIGVAVASLLVYLVSSIGRRHRRRVLSEPIPRSS